MQCASPNTAVSTHGSGQSKRHAGRARGGVNVLRLFHRALSRSRVSCSPFGERDYPKGLMAHIIALRCTVGMSRRGRASVPRHNRRRLEIGEHLLDNAVRVGSYSLTEQLGSGGMGDVWLGKHQLLARRRRRPLVPAGCADARRRVGSGAGACVVGGARTRADSRLRLTESAGGTD